MTPTAETARIVLLGAGHAHLLAIPRIRRALPKVTIQLVDPSEVATYSGMLPGVLAGHYALREATIDLAAYAARHGVTVIRARAVGVGAQEVRLAGNTGDGRIGFDLLSLDIGSHSGMPEIDGFDRHAVAVKPLDGFMRRMGALPTVGPRPLRVAVIGGGVAGVEIALALVHRQGAEVCMFESGPAIARAVCPATASRLTRALERAGVRVIANAQVARITLDGVCQDDGSEIAADVVIGAAGARAHGWLAADLPVDAQGFVVVDPTLQVQGRRGVFAAGDCAAMEHAPRPKAGVFAVRQAPVLAHNLIASVRGAPLQSFQPQKDYLKLVSLGARLAVAEWRGITVQGRWVWWLKDRIDTRFMAGLHR